MPKTLICILDGNMPPNDPFPDLVIGYPKLAAKIGILPEAGIYRRFSALGAQNLLYYQAELTYLERKLKEQQLRDNHEKQGHGPDYGVDWYWLERSPEEGDARQLGLVLRIRNLLKEYNQALVDQSTILNYPNPSKWDLHHLQDYLQTPEMGPLALNGEDATIWGSVLDRKSHKADLVTLRPRAKKDAFSEWAANNTIFKLWFMKPSGVHGTVGYEDTTIYRTTYWITSVLASLMPIASILVLYCVDSMPARLWVIAIFNVLVSMCLMALANARRAEVFAITAAFAAVQVVFVSADNTTATY
ncbi:hypothetical protein B5807_08233 [Epicoccum nigrum]|uniref:DUF6594 domain-containing protein n=1 Tax=Epicoccum nigrum TaxID=105696 RepID=A0A1Y2LQQ2_EPING|nr:hypothetical protein B5807_08233 [Epicoccum nigrum]